MFIYKIWKEGDENFYIGSTLGFRDRKNGHKSRCNNTTHTHHNFKIYQHIRANGGWDSWNMDIIEECEDRCREKEIIKELNPSLNTYIYPISYDEEYKKKYREENADIIKEKQKKKYSCECGGKYTYVHKLRHFKSIKHKKYLSMLSIQDDSVDGSSEKSSKA